MMDLSRANWAPGPWDNELDRYRWTDPATGLECLILRHPSMGHLCGYVGLTSAHPAYGRGYGECLKGDACPGYRTAEFMAADARSHAEAATDDSERRSWELLEQNYLRPGYQPGHDWEMCEARLESILEVHGGITFAGQWHDPDDPDAGDLWWIGFDTGHCFDLVPSFTADPELARIHGPETQYRDYPYVRAEVESLAQQLAMLHTKAEADIDAAVDDLPL